jgi:hypothetical protein
MRAFALVSTLAFAFVLNAAPARAAPRRGARLIWARGMGADGCVGAMGLEEDVKARLGYDPFGLPSELSVEGTVVRAARGFRAELVTWDAAGRLVGTRQLASREADCRSLGEAVAVAITVAIDPEAPGTPPSAQVHEAPLSAPSPDSTAARPVEAMSLRARGHATLSGGASVGLVPGLAAVASLRAGRSFGDRWELGLGTYFWPERRVERVGFALATAALEACAAPWTSALWLRWCGALHLGLFQVFVHAPELTPVEVGMFPWAGGDTGPAVSFPLVGSLRLDARIAAVVPIMRRQALLRGQATPLWEQSTVAGRAELGLRAEF